jgi:nitrite reductase (NO-forming)
VAPAPDPRGLTAPPARPQQARGSWGLRDRPGVLWLVLAVLVALAHPWVPDAVWLLTHLVLLGALTHSAMVWSTHFAATILKSPPTIDDRRVQSRRLLLLLAGTTMVVVGVPATWWPLTVVGAVTVSTAVGWHAVQLVRRLRRALPGRFRVTVRFYVAAAACLPVGATFGVLLARQPADPWHGRLLAAHVATMALGWLGLTMTGTLVTLWPTMLRTRMDDRAERLARQSLPVFLVALVVIDATALAGLAVGTAAGIVLWLAALVWWGRALAAPLRRRPPRELGPASVGLALLWLAGGLVAAAVTVATRGVDDLGDLAGRIAAVIAAGFGLQLLTGALSHLVPSVLGGGPSVVRAGQRWLEKGAVARLTLVNGGLLVCLLPVPSTVRVVASALVLLALAAFVPLMLRGIRAAVAARRALVAGEPVETLERPAWSLGQLGAATSALALVVAVAGVLAGPAASSDLTAGAAPTGETTTVRVEAKDMAFHPSTIDVPAGDRLVVELVNTDDEDTHDLVLPSGAHTPRLAPGDSATLDVGVVGASTEGWCSVVGHRRMGMVLTIRVGSDEPARAAEHTHVAHSSDHDSAATSPAYDATLPPVRGRVHRVDLTIDETVLEVAPGVWQRRWTFDGQAPGPVLRGRVGDRFVVTVHNAAGMTHSIDFHAGERAPDEVMRAIPPGGSLVYRFTARRAGIWMYHCSTMPMSSHIAAGLSGAVVIEPPGLAPVDHEWVLVGSETFLGEDTTRAGADEVDDAAVAAEEPDHLAFNGRAFQYDTEPLRARVGERVRVWVLDAGPNRPMAFHVVGEQLDATWNEGAWTLRPGTSGGAQVLPLLPAQGGFVELTFDEPGRYPFVNHVMADAERGQHGVVEVSAR